MGVIVDAAMKPSPLKPGDTIGIIAPASPFEAEAFDKGIELLQGMGFATKTAVGLYERQGHLAGSDLRRIHQLHTMMDDDEVQGVMCARGGFGSLRIIADLDYNLLRNKIKPFIGFSDITALHMTLQQQLGWVTLHGPMVTSLARSDPATRQAFYAWVTGQGSDHLDLAGARCLQAGRARGVLKGGNLSTLCHLTGTPFAGNYRDAILMLEDTGEAPYRIDRMLTHMRLAGAFEGLAGLVIGTFDHCGSEEQMDMLMLDHFGSLAIPVLSGVAVGHGKRNLTLPLGVMAHLDTSEVTLEFLEKAFDG